jgi:ribosome-binding protein aMBF1 (putative translation factor)
MRGEDALWRSIYKSLKAEEEREARTHAKALAWRLEPAYVLAGFGAALARERAARGVSMRALAREARTSPDVLSNIEHGRTEPTLRTVARLAHALYLRPSELLQRAELAAGERPRESAPEVPDLQGTP